MLSSALRSNFFALSLTFFSFSALRHRGTALLFFLEIDIPFDRINSGVAARRKFRKKVISRNSDCIAPRLNITYLGEKVQKYFPVKFSQSTGSLGLNVSNH